MASNTTYPNNLNSFNMYNNEKNIYPEDVSYQEGPYTLIVRRNNLGCNCGYIVLPQFHRYDGFHYNDIPVSVHGGLTYAARENNNWVIGFDTCHIGDYVPNHSFEPTDYYWTNNDVLKELKHLLSQL
jgi:hypothetical protein